MRVRRNLPEKKMMVPSHKQENRKREKAFCASGLESFSPDPELVIYDQIVTDYKMLTGKPNAGAPLLPLLTIIFFIFYFCFALVMPVLFTI